jgi:hypothetical protein
MIHRFATFETAALFATLKRDQGYFAEILHENVGFLWGPLAMSGFGVIVSDLAADDGEVVPEPAPPEPSAFDELRGALMLATLAIPAVSLVFGIGIILQNLLRDIAYYPREMLEPLLVSILCITGAAIFVCWLGRQLSELTRVYRNPEHRLHGVVRFSHACFAWLFIVLWAF